MSAALECVLAISSLSSFASNSYQASPGDEGWQQFVQLVRAVNSGNLSAAQQAYDGFTQSSAANVADTHPNSRLAQALNQIGPALQAGDIGQAQQALSSMRAQGIGKHSHRAASTQAGAGGARSPAPADPNAPGVTLNITV